MTKRTLNQSVEEAVNEYLQMMGDQPVTDLYEMVLAEVEPSLLKSVKKYSRGNQSQMALILGINRATLRKKLKKYRLL